MRMGRASNVGLVAVACLACGIAAGQQWDHVHLMAADTASAAKWYADHLGGELTKSGRFDAVLFGSTLVKFNRGSNVAGSEGSAVDHIAFSVTDVQGTAKKLREAGAKVGAPNRRTSSVALAVDPWGTKIELLKDDDLRGFHHVHLKSTLPKSTAAWYANIFGGEVGKYKNVPNINAIRYGDMWVFVQSTVRPVVGTRRRSVDHLGSRFDDFDAAIERLKAEGVTFLIKPMRSGGHRIAFIEGPDGVKIEIVEAATTH